MILIVFWLGDLFARFAEVEYKWGNWKHCLHLWHLTVLIHRFICGSISIKDLSPHSSSFDLPTSYSAPAWNFIPVSPWLMFLVGNSKHKRGLKGDLAWLPFTEIEIVAWKKSIICKTCKKGRWGIFGCWRGGKGLRINWAPNINVTPIKMERRILNKVTIVLINAWKIIFLKLLMI